MDPPTQRALTLEEESAWRNRCWFKAAVCQSDYRLVATYTRLRLWLHQRGEFMSDRFLRRIHVWLEVLQANFELRGMTVTVDISTVERTDLEEHLRRQLHK